jgi:hypothetical protein
MHGLTLCSTGHEGDFHRSGGRGTSNSEVPFRNGWTQGRTTQPIERTEAAKGAVPPLIGIPLGVTLSWSHD